MDESRNRNKFTGESENKQFEQYRVKNAGKKITTNQRLKYRMIKIL
ncbi:hypothetical protein ACDX78_01340 [Virgibacillus oceani]